MVWGTAVSGVGVVDLVEIAVWYLPGRYNLCTHSLGALFEFCFWELYHSVQQVYENTVHCIELSMVC